MDNADLSVLKRIAEWRSGGHRVVMGTIVRTWGSAPRPIGSVVAIREDGQVAGSVSGGCIEDDLVDKVRRGSFGLEAPELMKYGISAEEANRFGLPCGGTLELVLEPVSERSRIETLVTELAEGRRIRRTLDLGTGEATLDAGPAIEGADVLQVDAARMVTFHGPRWRLLIIGAGQMTQYLAMMARALDYEVLICDPREEYADGWEVEGTHVLRSMPDDTVIAMKPDAHTAIIALTHDPKLDDLALIEALKSKAFYVGAIGSRANQEKRRQRLLEFDLTPEQIARMHGPIGLKNGARTPPEIAVSILAQLTAERYGYRIPEPVPVVKQQVMEAGCET
jgi:xanthine dehydrogenase accessory factor